MKNQFHGMFVQVKFVPKNFVTLVTIENFHFSRVYFTNFISQLRKSALVSFSVSASARVLKLSLFWFKNKFEFRAIARQLTFCYEIRQKQK